MTKSVTLPIIFCFALLFVSACSQTKKGENFKGTITAVNKDCGIPEGSHMIKVDGKWVMLFMGGLPPPDGYKEPVMGQVIGSDEKYGCSTLIGKEVEIFARKGNNLYKDGYNQPGEEYYTLEGNRSYYVKFVPPL